MQELSTCLGNERRVSLALTTREEELPTIVADLATSPTFLSLLRLRESQDSRSPLSSQEESRERGAFVPPPDGWSWDGAQQLCLGGRREGRWPGVCLQTA